MRWLTDLPAHQEHIVESSCGTAFSVLLRAGDRVKKVLFAGR